MVRAEYCCAKNTGLGVGRAAFLGLALPITFCVALGKELVSDFIIYNNKTLE